MVERDEIKEEITSGEEGGSIAEGVVVRCERGGSDL